MVRTAEGVPTVGFDFSAEFGPVGQEFLDHDQGGDHQEGSNKGGNEEEANPVGLGVHSQPVKV